MKVLFQDLQKHNDRFSPHFQQCLSEVLDEGWFLHGKFTQSFEKAFAAYCEVKYCVGVANGLDALTLIFLAKKDLEKWEDHDEVILPAHSFVASAQAVVLSGLRPVFVDIDEKDFLLDVSLIEDKITSRTRAIMPVHLYGKCCDMVEIGRIAEKYNLFILEDAAQAHGAFYEKKEGHLSSSTSKRVGSWGGAAAFSFYPGKNLGALGDGGAVVSHDEKLINRVRILANYGAPQKYAHDYLGRNSRLDELQAAFLLTKLKFLDKDNQRRQQIALRYITEIKNPSIILPYSAEKEASRQSVFHIFPILCQERELLQSYLHERGIFTQIHYPLPLHRQRCLLPYVRSRGSFPNAEKTALQEVSLPIGAVMEEDEVEYVIHNLNAFRL